MDKYHCYNDACINGGALKNCHHDIEDCKRDFYPAMALGEEDCFSYCSRECKAAVVMPLYDVTQKPRTVKEMIYRLQKMKERVKNTPG